MGHDDQMPARLSLPALKRDLAAYGELQDSFTKIARSVERDSQRLERQLLDAVASPWLDMQAQAADSIVPDFEAHARDLLGDSVRSVLDAQESITDSLDAEHWSRWLGTRLSGSVRSALDMQESITDSLDADDWTRWLGTRLSGSVRSALDAQESITDSLETVGATTSSLLDRLKESEAPFDNLGAAYLQAPEVASEMPAVDLPRPIGPPTRRARRREVVLVGVAAADPVEFLLENLIARREVAADPFLYECLTDVRYWLRVGRPRSTVDRAHSAVHRMLQIIALEAGWEYDRHDGVSNLYRYVRKHHPAFVAGDGEEKVLELFGPLGQILHQVNEIRNQHSLAHPSRGLVSEPSARFVVHMTLAVFELMADRDEAAQPDA